MPKTKTTKTAAPKTSKKDAPFGYTADGTPRTWRARGTAPPRHPIHEEFNAKQTAALSRVEKAQEKIKELEQEVQENIAALVSLISPCVTFVHPVSGEHLTITTFAGSDPKNPVLLLRPKPTGRKPSGT